MQETTNPFVYHVPVTPANFVGREELLSLIFNQLRSANRANIALHGPLGVGKTSLLDYVASPEIAAQRGLDPARFFLCKVDCQSLGDFTPDHFWRRLLRNMARTAEGTLRELIDGLTAKEQISFEDIQDMLDELEWSDQVLVVLLDEFECVVRTHTELAERMTRHLLGMLSSLGRRTPRVFAMIIATERPLSALREDLGDWRGSPFPTVFISQALPAFTVHEANELIDRALAGTGVAFNDDERRLIYERSEGHPAMLQAAAAALFEAKQRSMAGQSVGDIIQNAVARGWADPAPAAAPEIQLDDATGTVWVNGRRIEGMPNKEFKLLRYLYDHAGQICLKDDIWQAVWPEYEEDMSDYLIQKLVSRVRQKVEPTPGRPRYILTVRGRGYKFVLDR